MGIVACFFQPLKRLETQTRNEPVVVEGPSR